MYTKMDNSGVEEQCYEERHIQNVLEAIKSNFEFYFQHFIETGAGTGITAADFARLQKRMGISLGKSLSRKSIRENYIAIIREAMKDFERDQEDYMVIFDEELLEDYDEDADTFKSKVLKNECPIIRKTLANRKAKELDKYRAAFGLADADRLREVIYHLCVFGNAYVENYDSEVYEDAHTYHDLGMEPLDTEDYTVYGVIGGGIKTQMLYKVHPGQFPNRSRNAIWALWYLSGKDSFGCKTDSEFLMIDVSKSIVQQNYFYPYRLFAYYAFEIYKMLRDKGTEYGVSIDSDYRYVIVDAFFDYIAAEHEDEISVLKSQIRDGGMGFA